MNATQRDICGPVREVSLILPHIIEEKKGLKRCKSDQPTVGEAPSTGENAVVARLYYA